MSSVVLIELIIEYAGKDQLLTFSFGGSDGIQVIFMQDYVYCQTVANPQLLLSSCLQISPGDHLQLDVGCGYYRFNQKWSLFLKSINIESTDWNPDQWDRIPYKHSQGGEYRTLTFYDQNNVRSVQLVPLRVTVLK